MKYCPQCNRQFSEAWLTFCTNDGSILREDPSPPADPNWDPRIRPTQYDDPSERKTQWLPNETQQPGGWMATGERAPVDRGYRPPPPPQSQPYARPSAGPPGTAIASLILALVGLTFGFICGFPVPGILAVILGIIALRQMKTAPNPAGRGLAIAGIAIGSVSMVFFVFGMLWFILSLAFG